MKKFVSISLLLCIISYAFGVGAVDTASLKRADIERQAGLLQTIGIIESIEDEAKGNGAITRAEFAVAVGKTMGAQESADHVRYFTDVPMSHWARSYINALVEMNIIELSEDRQFRPNDKITLDEAVKMLICALGYGKLGDAMGGFPVGYSQIAQTLDFELPGGRNDMTIYQSYIVLYDALRAETYGIRSVENDSVNYERSGETLLSQYFDIYEAEGIVQQSSGIAIDGEVVKGKSNEETFRIVRIEGEQYKTDLDFYDYIGRRTHIYYHQEDGGDDKTIVYREDFKSFERVIDIKADALLGFENDFLTYEENEKTREIKIPVGTVVVKNGEIVRENMADAIYIKRGNMRVIDAEDDGIVDVVLIWEYKNIVAGSVRAESFEVYDTVIYGNQAQLDPDEKLVIIEDTSGNRKDFSDILVGSLISVYESKQYARVILSQDPVSATLYSISREDDKYMAEIGKGEADRMWYEIDADFYESYLKGTHYETADGSEGYTGDINLPVGATVTYYVDAGGKIAYMTGLAMTDWAYGYLVKISSDKGVDNHPFVKLYTQNDAMEIYQCSDRVKIDGMRKENFEEIQAALTKERKASPDEHDINGQLVRFKLNSENKISDIDTERFYPDREDRLSLHYTGSMENMTYWYHPGCFPGGVHFYDQSTVKFIVPKQTDLENASERDFRLLASFSDYVPYTFDTYRLDPKGANENVFVIYEDQGQSATVRGPYLVGRVYEALDSDGNVVAKADLYDIESTDMLSVTAQDGYFFEFEEEDADGQSTVYTVDKGDIVYANIDGDGKVESIVVYNDYSRMGSNEYQGLTGWKNVSSPRQTDAYADLLCAYFKSEDDEIYRFVYGEPLTDEDLTDSNYSDCTWATRSDLNSVLVFDGDRVKQSTAAELVPAVYTGAENAKPYWFAVRYARLKGAVVYE